MLEQRLAKMEKILLSPAASKNNTRDSSTTTATTLTNEHDDDAENDYREDGQEDNDKSSVSRSSTLNTSTEDPIPSNNTSNRYNHTHSNKTAKYNATGSKRSSGEDNNNNHDATSPTSFSSISSNFPSPPAHLMSLHQYPENRNDALPCMSVIEHMVDLYFTYLFSVIPIFEEVTLRRDIRERKCSDFMLLSLLAVCAR
jgi:hypothetical protein